MGSIYNQYQGEILELSVVDNKLNIFTLDGNKRVIVIDPVSNFNDEISIQEVVREATSGLHQCFKSNLDAQEQHNIVYEDETIINLFTQMQTEKGLDTLEGFFKKVLYYWKLVSISQFITDDFQGTLSKQDYLITTKTITIEQLKTLGITKIFDEHRKELSLSGELKGSYRILTSEDRKYRALIEVTGENVRTPNGWVDGICIAGTWIRNALLTNKEGNLLSSSFFNPYNPTSFKIKNYNWLEIEFLLSLTDADKDYLYYDDNGNGNPCGVNLLTVFSLTDGNSILNLEMLVTLINPAFRTDRLKFEFSQIKPYFEDLILIQDSYKDELVSVYWGSPPPPEFKSRISIEREFNRELDALSLLFYRVREYLSEQNIRTLPITDKLVGLLGPDDSKTYTIEYLKDLLQALDIDNEFLIGWFSDQKTFYRVLLDHIHQASTNPNIDQELRASFEQIVERLDNKEFTDNRRFTDNDEDLLRILDEALNNLFGYVGYVLLQLGLIKFDDTNNKLRFELPENLDVLKERIEKFGINSIAELSPFWTGDVITEYFIYSILFSGHYKEFIKMNDPGQSHSKIHTYPGSQFFKGVFKNFVGNIPDSTYHLAMIWIFMNSHLITERFEMFQCIEQARNPIFYTGIEQKLRNLHILKQVGNRIIWQEYELIGGTDTFQIEETIMDQNGYYHRTGNTMDHFYIWLKYGDIREGFLHIIEDHGKKHFEDEWNLMSDKEKSDFILETIKTYKGYRIRNNLILYQVYVDNRIEYLCIAFNQDFHFIITAYRLDTDLREYYLNLFN